MILLQDLGLRQKGTQKKRYGLYRCKCGKEIECEITRVKHNRTKSCGCLKAEKARERTIKRNTTHGLSKTPQYKVWKDMKSRCYNTSNKCYNLYGSRGIVVCDEWLNNYLAFYEWSIANGYSKNLTIDRIDVNGNYEPSNCRWVDDFTQAKNKRPQYNKTGKTGVSYIDGKYTSIITYNKKKIYLGYFNTVDEAYEARRQFIIENKTGHRE